MIFLLFVVQGEETSRSVYGPPQEAHGFARVMPSIEVSGHCSF
jgi:hypothetical protein